MPEDEKKEAEGIVKGLSQNLEKTSIHGKRTDGIVQGMLQHSSSTTGGNEPTDVNALADEYLRLAYHGFRAKDNSYNAMVNTHFEPTIGLVNMIPQDIGRLLLNLYNNAFYAVSEKKNQQPGGHEPSVSITTRKSVNKIQMSVKDKKNFSFYLTRLSGNIHIGFNTDSSARRQQNEISVFGLVIIVPSGNKVR